jgi:hypothetical protein
MFLISSHERAELTEEPPTKKPRLEEPPAYRMLRPGGMLPWWNPSVMKYMFRYMVERRAVREGRMYELD